MPTLDWIGKDAVKDLHKNVEFHLLREAAELSVGDASGNLLVEGDNLLALKALLPYYAGKVKCIYIDPPYNTGNEGWVYNDAVNSPEMRAWLGKVVGGEAEDLSRHDKWLCMMYPRLTLLRELLSEDGAIFINIDDNEAARLKCLMDELFGPQNFIASVVWQKVYSPRMDAKSFSNDHDTIIIYQRSERFKVKKVSFAQNADQFTFFDEKKQEYYRRRSWRKEGSGARREDRPNLYYQITSPDEIQVYPNRPDGSEGRWRGDFGHYSDLEAQDLIEWINTTNGWQIYVKQFLQKDATQPPSTIWFHDEVGHNHEAAEELKKIFGYIPFQTPKPTRLLQRILQIATNPGDLVLDSFAGSGTTGHAVMQLNQQDGGSRRFILVEIDSAIARSITAERLRRVSQGYTWKDQKGNERAEAGLGGGFRYCQLGPTLFDADGQIRPEVTFIELAQLVYFKETGAPLPAEYTVGSPLLGVHNGVAVYLLYNGILKDKSLNGGNALTTHVLKDLPEHIGSRVIYGTACHISQSYRNRSGIVFKQIPYELKVG